MSRLNTKQVVMAVTSFTAILYILCAALVFVAPNAFLKVVGQWAHGIDMMQIARTPTITETITGFISLMIVTIIFSALFVALWNKWDKRKEVK